MPGYTMRYSSYVGFVSPPNSFENSPQHFLQLVDGDAIGVTQHVVHMPDFEYVGLSEHDSNAAAVELESFENGVAALADAQAEIVAQVGCYWAMPFHADDEAARRLEAELSDKHGVRVVLVWNAMVDALRVVGARKLSLATGYYRPEWTARSVAYLESAGFEILWAGDVVDQGIVADLEGKMAIEKATRWDYPDHIVRAACLDAAARAPEAEAVVQIGAGMRPALQIAAIEDETGLPLVATDFCLYWAVLKAAGVPARAGSGRLLGTTR